MPPPLLIFRPSLQNEKNFLISEKFRKDFFNYIVLKENSKYCSFNKSKKKINK